MSDRSKLRATILAIVKANMDRPIFKANEALADELTALVRQAQHDAWTRGYAAAQLDFHDREFGRQERRSPYRGGRHAGPPQPWMDEATAELIASAPFGRPPRSSTEGFVTAGSDDQMVHMHRRLTDEQVEWDSLALPIDRLPQRVVLPASDWFSHVATATNPERNINNDTDPDAIDLDLGPKYKRAW